MKKELLSSNFLIPTIVIAIIYSIIVTYAMNTQLVIDTILGSFSLQYKITLLFALIQGMWTAMSGIGFFVLLLTAFLTGANLTLLWAQIRTIKSFTNLHVVVGGNSLLGLVGSGCAACGLPILSLLGISGSFALLPLHGTEISYLAVMLLSISFFLLLRSSLAEKVCIVPTKQ